MRNPAKGVAGIAEVLGQLLDVTTLDDAETGAGQQKQHGGDGADAVGKVPLEQHDHAVLPGAIEPRPGAGTIETQPRAQPRNRAHGGGFQVSLGPRRSQRPGEASCTIHCTSSSHVAPATALRVLAQMPSRSCRAGVDLEQEEATFPSMRSSKRKSATARAPAAKRHMRRQR